MPKVGKKHFAYTKKGVKEAKEEAKKTHLPLTMKPMTTVRASATTDDIAQRMRRMYGKKG